MMTRKPLQNRGFSLVMVGPEGVSLSNCFNQLDNFTNPFTGTAFCGVPPKVSNKNGPAVLADHGADQTQRNCE